MAGLADSFKSAASVQRRFEQIARQVGKSRSPAIPTSTPSTWMSTRELAEFLRLNDRHRPLEAARDWADQRRLAYVFVGRERRYSRRDIERALEETRTRGGGWANHTASVAAASA